MKKLVIDPVTRIEGHAKIDIFLDDAGHVTDTHFHVTQVRGFEKFTEGRPFYEMPAITAPGVGLTASARADAASTLAWRAMYAAARYSRAFSTAVAAWSARLWRIDWSPG